MSRLVWAICCERPIVDAETNSLSLINIIEELSVPAPEAVLGERVHIISLWEKAADLEGREDAVRYRVTLTTPDGEVVGRSVVIDNAIPPTHARLRSVLALEGIPLKGGGRYAWRVEIEKDEQWEAISELPLIVKISELAPPA